MAERNDQYGSADRVDVVAFLRSLPDGSVFTHANPNVLPDSWVKIAENRYRRTYDWIEFETLEFKSWEHAELTEPIEGSFDQAEADRRSAVERRRPPRTEMGG